MIINRQCELTGVRCQRRQPYGLAGREGIGRPIGEQMRVTLSLLDAAFGQHSAMLILNVDSPIQDIGVGSVLVAAVGLDTIVHRRSA